MRPIEGATNDYGSNQITYADEDEIACSFSDDGGDEVVGSLMGVPKADATFWVAQGTAVAPNYRIRLTERFGTPVTVRNIYQVTGEPSHDVLLYKIKAKLVPEKDT